MFSSARRLTPYAAAAALALGLAACSSGSGGSGTPSDDGRLQVTAAFYPLAYAVEQIGGEHVEVSTLTKPGAEPHDVELTPKEVGGLSKAALVVYLKGFQSAVDDAVDAQAADHSLDVTKSARLDIAEPDTMHGEEGHADEGHAGAMDPHFWLDPTRYADVATAIGAELAAKDPANAAAYTTGARDLGARLRGLDAEMRTGLKTCTNRVLVTGHAAFGYLAHRYELTQEPVAGISPDAEPTAAQLAAMATTVRESGVTTVYSETLASPALVETLARETGAKVAVLDPIEGLSDASAGKDYFAVMRANLATLRTGQGCS